MTDVNPVPDGYHTVTPYLLIDGEADAIEFYKKAFGAEEIVRMPAPDGRIKHAEIRVGDSMIMLADAPEDRFSPEKLGGTTVLMSLYVPDVDALFKQALDAGASETRPVADQFYGDRNGQLADPFGHHWYIATRIEDLTLEQIEDRAAKLFGARE